MVGAVMTILGSILLDRRLQATYHVLVAPTDPTFTPTALSYGLKLPLGPTRGLLCASIV